MTTATEAPTEVPVQRVTGRMIELSAKGDEQRVTWDRDDPNTVANARRVFEDLKKKGYSAFKVDASDPKKKAGQVKDFDPNIEEIVLVKPLVGG